MLDKYLGPHEVVEVKNNGIYRLKNIKTGKKLVKMVNVVRFKMFKGIDYKVSKHNQPVMDEVSDQDDDKVECKMQEGNITFDHGVLTNQLYCQYYLHLWTTGAAEHCYRAD